MSSERVKPTVYRMFDAEGRLLYVGHTVLGGVRFDQHRSTKRRWTDIARIELEHFATEVDARGAERAAIWLERPLYNVDGQAPAELDTDAPSLLSEAS